MKNSTPFLWIVFITYSIFIFDYKLSSQSYSWNPDGSVTVTDKTLFSTLNPNNMPNTVSDSFTEMTRLNLALPLMINKLYNRKKDYIEVGDIHDGGFAEFRVYFYDHYSSNKKGKLVYGVRAKANGKKRKSWMVLLADKLLLASDIHKSNSKKLSFDNRHKLISQHTECEEKFNTNKSKKLILDLISEINKSGGKIMAPFVDGLEAHNTETLSDIGANALISTTDSNNESLSYGDYLDNTIPRKCVNQILNQPVIIELEAKNVTVKNIRMPGPETSYAKMTPNDIFKTGAGTRPRSEKILELMNNPLDYPNYVVIAAHRGYWAKLGNPENSTASYDATIEAGIDMVELDVRLTKDRVLVAFHDVCLDRIAGYCNLSDGTEDTRNQNTLGYLRNYNWPYIKEHICLRDRDGNMTNYKMLSIEEALNYLRGKTLINFDIKEYNITGKMLQHTLRDWEVESDRYKKTFNASIALAKDLGMLDQLLIKGKFTSNDIDDAMEDAGIALGDINYTPVTFGWDTAKSIIQADAFIRNPDINIMELTYKVEYDPLLEVNNNYPLSVVGKAINRGKRVGNYTYWPETCEGVWAEDFAITGHPKKDNQGNNIIDENGEITYDGEICKPNHRFFSHLNLKESGPINTGDPYSSPSRTQVDEKEWRKRNSLNDARGDWDWLLSKGANMLITDRPVLLKEYLETHNLRSETSPVITEVKLGKEVEVTKKNTKELVVSKLEGMARKIKDYRMVEFFTPDTRNVDISCDYFPQVDLNNPDYIYKTRVTNGINKNQCQTLKEKKCKNIYGQPTYFGALANNADEIETISQSDVRKYPLKTLPQWSLDFPDYDIFVNANFFDVFDTIDKSGKSILNNPSERSQTPLPNAPYQLPCSDIFGHYQPNGSEPLSTVFEPEPSSKNYDAFIWDKSGDIHLVSNSINKNQLNSINQDIVNYYDGNLDNGEAEMGLGGFILAKNGIITIPPKGVNNELVKRRVLVGINGYEMMIAYFDTQSRPREAAQIMMDFGYTDVFMFDAGGSAQMISSSGRYPNNGIQAGPGITSGNVPRDIEAPSSTKRVYRPVPAFLAIRVKEQFKDL